MEELSERERTLLVRGDVAMSVLKAVLNQLTPANATALNTVQQLKKVAEKSPTTGQPTLLSVVTQVNEQMQSTLNEVITFVELALKNIDEFTGEEFTDELAKRSVANVLAGARISSESLSDKSDEELKQILGL